VRSVLVHATLVACNAEVWCARQDLCMCVAQWGAHTRTCMHSPRLSCFHAVHTGPNVAIT